MNGDSRALRLPQVGPGQQHRARLLERQGPNYFDWTVPNWPTQAAVLDIRFGCEPGYPETYAPQPASTFVIARR